MEPERTGRVTDQPEHFVGWLEIFLIGELSLKEIGSH